MSYRVKLNVFEGPFDLLVYLIEHAQMNIYDINITDITRQYLDYIDDMKNADIAVSSEFMVLASALLEIKSRMLLPRPTTGGGEESMMEDPRTELVSKLLDLVAKLPVLNLANRLMGGGVGLLKGALVVGLVCVLVLRFGLVTAAETKESVFLQFFSNFSWARG